MVGERRKKRPATNRGSRPGSRKGARGGASRSTATVSRERRKKSSKARVIQFPQGRQPKHSKPPGRRKSGSGRVRLIVAAGGGGWGFVVFGGGGGEIGGGEKGAVP